MIIYTYERQLVKFCWFLIWWFEKIYWSNNFMKKFWIFFNILLINIYLKIYRVNGELFGKKRAFFKIPLNRVLSWNYLHTLLPVGAKITLKYGLNLGLPIENGSIGWLNTPESDINSKIWKLETYVYSFVSSKHVITMQVDC